MKCTLSNGLGPLAVAVLLSLPGAKAQSSPSPAAIGAKPSGHAVAASPIAGHPVAGKTAQERVENRIKELHAQLHITPAEQPQWEEFASAVRENARDMDQVFMERAQQFPTLNAPQNMQSDEKIAEEHAKHVQKLVPAFENPYNVMPDQQKQLADQVFRSNAEQHLQRAAQRGRNG